MKCDAKSEGCGSLPFVCFFRAKIVNNSAINTSKSEHGAHGEEGAGRMGLVLCAGTIRGLLPSAVLVCLPLAAVTW